MKLIVLELRIVWLEIDVGTVLVLRRFRHIRNQFSTLEDGFAYLSFTIAAYLEMRAQGIDSLHTHTVQTDRLLESLGVELTTGVQNADTLDELALGDASAIVAHRDAEVVLYVDFDAIACPHLELIDGVVEYLFQQDVDTVL